MEGGARLACDARPGVGDCLGVIHTLVINTRLSADLETASKSSGHTPPVNSANSNEITESAFGARTSVDAVRAVLRFNQKWRRYFVSALRPRFLPTYYDFETNHEPEELTP